MTRLAALGPDLSDIAWRVICAGETMPVAEREMAWPARSGKLVLRIALDRLADFYRLPGGLGCHFLDHHREFEPAFFRRVLFGAQCLGFCRQFGKALGLARVQGRRPPFRFLRQQSRRRFPLSVSATDHSRAGPCRTIWQGAFLLDLAGVRIDCELVTFLRVSGLSRRSRFASQSA